MDIVHHFGSNTALNGMSFYIIFVHACLLANLPFFISELNWNLWCVVVLYSVLIILNRYSVRFTISNWKHNDCIIWCYISTQAPAYFFIQFWKPMSIIGLCGCSIFSFIVWKQGRCLASKFSKLFFQLCISFFGVKNRFFSNRVAIDF